MAGSARTAPEVYQNTKCDSKKHRSENNKWLQLSDLHHNDSKNGPCNYRREAVERVDASGAEDRLVKADIEDGKQEVGLNIPCWGRLAIFSD